MNNRFVLGASIVALLAVAAVVHDELAGRRPVSNSVTSTPTEATPAADTSALPASVAPIASVPEAQLVVPTTHPTSLAGVAAREKLPRNKAAKRRGKGVPPADPPPANPDGSAPVASTNEPSIAREALGLVGIDEAAEAVWVASINDPTIDAEARKNLIEDLNEDGFPDPEHVTSEDLPLIMSRMQMIELLAPDAMDEVNAAAFQEAYKDLTEMLAKVIGS